MKSLTYHALSTGDFTVYATNSKTSGWKITSKCQAGMKNSKQCQQDDNGDDESVDENAEKCSTYKAAWVVSLIALTIAETPMGQLRFCLHCWNHMAGVIA